MIFYFLFSELNLQISTLLATFFLEISIIQSSVGRTQACSGAKLIKNFLKVKFNFNANLDLKAKKYLLGDGFLIL